TQAKPGDSYEQKLVDARNEIQKLQDQLAQLTNEKKQADTKAKAAEDLQKKDRTEYDTQLAALNKKAEEDKSDLLKRKDELQALVDQLGKDKEQLLKQAEAETKTLRAELQKHMGAYQDLRKLLDQKEADLRQAKSQGSDAPKDWRTDWKIVRID